MNANMKEASSTPLAGTEQKFYLYTSFSLPEVLRSDTVFYKVTGEESARTLSRLFCKEYSSEVGQPTFLLKRADQIAPDEQLLLDEALDSLNQYDDPDPYIYDSPPSKETMMRAEYARRASGWEDMILARTIGQRNCPPDQGADKKSDDAGAQTNDLTSGQVQMTAEEMRNSALNLLLLLAQAYYKILECVISTASWCSALDLQLNESYLWTITNLKNLLTNHEALRDFPGAFEPMFPDLYPSTIRDLDWEDMVAPEVEQFLSTVQRYAHSNRIYPPEESSPSWVFVELFRPSVNTAIERAIAYNKRMRQYARRALGADLGASEIRKSGPGGAMKSAFISYSWDDEAHREWVRKLAERLRADGVDVSIDRWAAAPGDQLPAFMEKAIRENQYVVRWVSTSLRWPQPVVVSPCFRLVNA
jgi:hypothetical protein